MGWLKAKHWAGVYVILGGMFFGTSLFAGHEGLARAARAESLDVLNRLDWSNPKLVARIKKAKYHAIDVKQSQGSDPQCGYYALSHALSGFDKKAPNGREVYEFAKENGWYWDEEGSSIGRDLYHTVQGLGGYKVEHGWGLTRGTMKYLRSLLRWGYGVVVAVRGVSDEGLPKYDGFFKIGGHWVAVEGFVTIDEREYLIIKDSNRYSGQPDYIDRHLDGSTLWQVDVFESAWSFGSYVALKPAE